MNRDEIQLLFQYDRWANGRVLEAAAALSNEQFTRDLGGSFRSVRDTLVHIVAGEWGWLTYWKAASHSDALLTELWNNVDTVFRADLFPDIAAVRAKWKEIEREQIEFVDLVTDDTLKKKFPVRKTHLSLAQLMQHMANHSTYHRGQISLMMRQLGAEPIPTDFALFLWQSASAFAATS